MNMGPAFLPTLTLTKLYHWTVFYGILDTHLTGNSLVYRPSEKLEKKRYKSICYSKLAVCRNTGFTDPSFVS